MINILSFVINVNDINLIYLEKIKARAFILEKISSLVSGDLFSLLFSRLGIPTLKIKVGAHETIFVMCQPIRSLRVRHQFLRDFSRPTEIRQYP